MKTYPETVDFLYTKLPMFSHLGQSAFKKDLTNIRILCQELGNPQEQFKSIHVAGTNGKGSVSHMLAAIMQQSGYKTGLHTSPHLKDFRERIKINGEMATQEFVVEFVHNSMDLIRKITPSFFEITVAMAFQWFAQNKVDIAIVEVGLGGRLDSTNILQPDLSVITNISLDHQHILGHQLKDIAAEKAGIIKPFTPVIIGETHAETMPVFNTKAQQCQAPILFADQQWEILHQEQQPDKQVIQLQATSGEKLPVTYTLDLTGQYQSHNLLTALSATDTLKIKRWNLPEENIKRALTEVKKQTGLRGRWEILAKNPLTIADVAHNAAGIAEVMQQVKMLPGEKLYIVTGFVKDKPVESMLDLFPKEARYYFCQADIPRALPAEELKRMAANKGLEGIVIPDVKQALEAARCTATTADIILICGSVFIAAEALP